MGVEISANEADIARVMDAVAAFAASTGREVGKALKEEMRTDTRRVIANLPPFTKAYGEDTTVKDRLVGETAVRRDLHRCVVCTVEELGITNPSLKAQAEKYFRGSRWFDLQGLFNSAKFNLEVRAFTPADHLKWRNRRGRVPEQKGRRRVFATNPDVVAGYLQQEINRVGTMKASLAPGMRKLDGRLPAWVRRNSEHGSAETEGLDDDTPVKRVEIESTANGIASTAESTGALRRAFAGRDKALARRAEKIVAAEAAKKKLS
jgi:hypothetical protein